MNQFFFRTALLLVCLLSAACTSNPPARPKSPPGWIQSSLRNLSGKSSQILLVTNEHAAASRGMLYVLEKSDNLWHGAFPPFSALIGKKGFAPPGEKKEGDGRTPSGVFALKRTFGHAQKIGSLMPYRQAGIEDIWVDDASAADYNHWVRKGETTANSFELMKREDDCYKYGIIVEYNTDPVVPGAGSAIFIHVRRGEDTPTLGCIALAESDMLKLLGWLNPKAEPLVVLGTREDLPLLTKEGCLFAELDWSIICFVKQSRSPSAR
jgi:L,D-peptidoglycan transpeptidase YkuD (ErfK/YbiS/YcfS/YnhG family)